MAFFERSGKRVRGKILFDDKMLRLLMTGE
jgi:hypothetical protein